MQHQSQKILHTNYDRLWELLYAFGEQPLITPSDHKFAAIASAASRGSHHGQKFIQIRKYGQESARIYSCCWGHTTSCYGSRIGGYSDGLDSWARGLMMRTESLVLKPSDEVVRNLGRLLNSAALDYDQALKHLPREPGVYLISHKRQKRYLYVGRTKDLRKRIQQHAQRQNETSRLYAQPVQKGLINSGRCSNSKEAQKYLSSKCAVKYLVVPDEERRVYPWMKRSLLEHYAICVMEPEYNISGEFEH